MVPTDGQDATMRNPIGSKPAPVFKARFRIGFSLYDDEWVFRRDFQIPFSPKFVESSVRALSVDREYGIRTQSTATH